MGKSKYSKKGAVMEISARVLNPISYEKPIPYMQFLCQLKRPK
jgi:hypothetical protein